MIHISRQVQQSLFKAHNHPTQNFANFPRHFQIGHFLFPASKQPCRVRSTIGRPSFRTSSSYQFAPKSKPAEKQNSAPPKTTSQLADFDMAYYTLRFDSLSMLQGRTHVSQWWTMMGRIGTQYPWCEIWRELLLMLKLIGCLLRQRS